MMKRTRQEAKTATSQNVASKQTPDDTEKLDLDGLLEEARESLYVLAGLFAIVDGELTDGGLTGSPGHRRERFNLAAMGISQALDAIEATWPRRVT